MLTATNIAYDQTMKVLVIAATVIAILPIIFAFMSPEFYLGDQQNAVDQIDLKGETIRELREKDRADKKEKVELEKNATTVTQQA